MAESFGRHVRGSVDRRRGQAVAYHFLETAPVPLQPGLPKTGDIRKCRRRTHSERNEYRVGYYKEEGPMLAPGLFFSKHKQTAENREALPIQVLSSFGREVCSLRAGCRILHLLESRALLGDPFRSPQGMESLVQSLS